MAKSRNRKGQKQKSQQRTNMIKSQKEKSQKMFMEMLQKAQTEQMEAQTEQENVVTSEDIDIGDLDLVEDNSEIPKT